MPGPKYPSGYARIYHTIAAKLTIDRPARLVVTIPEIHCGYARSTFNYFRQSWLRHYQFMVKNKDMQSATAALEMFNNLSGYMVQISPPSSLIFTSKSIEAQATFEMEGQIERDLQSWLPQREHKMEISDETEREVERMRAKRAEEEAMRALGIVKKERVISDNPPPPADIPTDEYSNKYGLPIGPPPGFFDKKSD